MIAAVLMALGIAGMAGSAGIGHGFEYWPENQNWGLFAIFAAIALIGVWLMTKFANRDS